ncbi:MAG: hypothetical protein R3D85_02195 [Paracoccaceae bacterium]
MVRTDELVLVSSTKTRAEPSDCLTCSGASAAQGADADIAVVVDHQRVRSGAGTDAEGQGAAMGGIADEEAGLVAGQVPGLGLPALRAVLLEPQRRRVALGPVNADRRVGVAEGDPAAIVDIERVAGRERFEREDGAVVGGVFDRELVLAATGGVVRRQLPVDIGETARGRGVVELDPQVVFLQAQRVEAEAFAVDAVEADAGRAIDDQIVVEDLIGLGDARAQAEGRRGRKKLNQSLVHNSSPWFEISAHGNTKCGASLLVRWSRDPRRASARRTQLSSLTSSGVMITPRSTTK